MIVEALKSAGRPVSAYEIIDQLREQAVLAPQTVYRALDRLIASGSAHRLESLNAFVACAHATHAGASDSPQPLLHGRAIGASFLALRRRLFRRGVGRS